MVIVTRNREGRLRRALAALDGQTLARDRFEVIVVRAADTPQPWTDAPEGLPVRFLTHHGPPGEAVQRNAGWQTAGAPIVAFTDDDCRPHPEWLERILGASVETPGIVQGRTEPDPEDARSLYGLARTIEVTEPSGRYETCNVAYPRDLLERLGGFDEEISGPVVWTVDTEMGLRAVSAGAEFRFANEALVWHAVIPRTLSQAIAETPRYAWLVRLLARYPQHRRERFPFRLVKPSHATLLLAVGALAARRRAPLLSLVAATPYLAGHLRTHLETNAMTPLSMARFASHLPKATLVELAELGVVLVAAARERTLVI